MSAKGWSRTVEPSPTWKGPPFPFQFKIFAPDKPDNGRDRRVSNEVQEIMISPEVAAFREGKGKSENSTLRVITFPRQLGCCGREPSNDATVVRQRGRDSQMRST